jgi:hypothetical protein
MIRGKMEPSVMPTMVRAVPTMIHAAKKTTEIP